MTSVDSAYIDLAIGLAVAFFLLSLASSALNELVVMATRIRSKFLWAYLNHLFTEGDATASEGTAAREAALAMEPTPSTSTPPPGAGPLAGAQVGKRDAVPLPSSGGGLWRLMTATMTRDPRPAAGGPVSEHAPFTERLLRQLRPIEVGSAIRGRRESTNKKTTVKHLPPSSLAQAVLEVFKTSDPAKPGELTGAIDQLAGTPVHASLKALWATSENEIAEFRGQLERWFDAEMARLSGLYKRLIRWILAIAAVIVALIVNLDPIALGRDLWRDPNRRAEFIELAETATAPADTGGDTAVDLDLAGLLEQCDVDAEGEEPTPEDFATAIESTRSCVLDALEQQRDLGLLTTSLFEGDRFADSWEQDGIARVLKLALVAASITLGAPFWYDILRRLLGVRSAVTRRET